MESPRSKLDSQLEEGAKRLLSRVQDSYGLTLAIVVSRLRKGIEKYVLADDPEPERQVIENFIDTLHADDLCLVVACESGNETAWNDLITRFSATVRSAARSVAGNEDTAEDLAQSIWAELHGLRTREGSLVGKIGYYSGRGSLGGWLRAVVGQLAVDQHRKLSRFVQAEEDTDLERLSNTLEDEKGPGVSSSVGPNPETAFVTQRTSAAVESALSKALGELPAEDKLLVKLYYFDGLKLREAGAVLGVHEATASRRLTRVQKDIRRRVEELLSREHGWSSVEVLRELSEAAALLQSDVEAMLTGHDPPDGTTSGRVVREY